MFSSVSAQKGSRFQAACTGTEYEGRDRNVCDKPGRKGTWRGVARCAEME